MTRIAGWDDLAAALTARKARLRALADGKLELTLPLDAYTSVAVRLAALADDRLELVAVVGSGRALPVAASLANNAASVVGAYCFVDGAVALRQVLPLGGLRLADLEFALRAIAWRVVETRRQLST
jgi:hypothetical protein